MYIKDITELREKFLILYEQAKHLLEYTSVDADVKEHKNKRTKAQNDFYHQMCTEIADFLRKHCPPYGEDELDWDKEIVHRINKKKFDVETTTKMSVHEFCDYTTQIIEYWQRKTRWNWTPSETPMSYLRNHGYTEEYTKGYINDKDV